MGGKWGKGVVDYCTCMSLPGKNETLGEERMRREATCNEMDRRMEHSYPYLPIGNAPSVWLYDFPSLAVGCNWVGAEE